MNKNTKEANFLFEDHISQNKQSFEKYQQLLTQFQENSEAFWEKQADRISWSKRPAKIKNVSFHRPVHIRWFEDGEMNLSYNCIDRHLEKKSQDIALIWEPDRPDQASQKITYQKLFDEVNRIANVLKSKGIGKGDFVTIYMPMIPQAVYVMLACCRIGAVHNVIFGGFAPDSIVDRVMDCDSKWIITCDYGFRGGKKIHLKENIQAALKKLPAETQVLLFNYDSCVGSYDPHLDNSNSQNTLPNHQNAFPENWHLFETAFQKNSLSSQPDKVNCKPEKMNAEDPLFILYTSGSTNKPKGVLHTTGGYAVYASFTHQTIFDYKDQEIYWCTADVGWVTGHSYMVYGPLLNGATTLMFEGIPTFPTASRFWEVIDKHQVNIFYTAPTALRALMKEGDHHVGKASRKSLRILGTVGEPINPEAWRWYFEVVGNSECPVVDTWWQTETGGILITPLPGATALKPGSATRP
ncbi:MAG: AMP-binding protein, partial [Pseudobdellovibrionaceae bacterium]